ncbi:putative redox protein, regulator of disulfide bond formation [Geoglobus ahangari]|uniref:Putative redox protein, regulator of disulfide bond formation n=1 Tax=Geoglobus ahangari TaxID=113653 RepID=A0A0F7IHZ2_9EURY|nr:sulfurtransferase TusA family protein [Geoglobus ahangari]AKG92629.1 putative redox protein, regulator of disulfide bond formation [Geoglobus ahangari]
MRRVDLRGEVCPFTFVRTKVAMEDMEPGEVFEIITDHEPAVRDLPRSLEAEGHEVISVEEAGEQEWRIVVRKKAD